MSVKSRIAAVSVALVTVLSIVVPAVASSTEGSANADDPSLSIPRMWDQFTISNKPFPLPLMRQQLFPLLENMKTVVSDTKKTIQDIVYPPTPLQPAAQCIAVVPAMTMANQTPIAMDVAANDTRIALENQKKEEEAKKIAKARYAIATLPQDDVRVATSSDPATRVMYVSATAYSSTPDQTDGSPCTTANGFNVCKNNQENILAANFLPFGTRVRIPDMFGDRVFTVQDRMARRFSNRVDVWMKSREAALQFGARKIKIEVLEN